MAYSDYSRPRSLQHGGLNMLKTNQLPELEEFRSFYRLWQNARTDGQLPNRSDIRLEDFAPHAPNLIIIERNGPGYFSHRLVGASVSERFGSIGKTENLLSFHAEEARETTRRWLDTILDTPCGGVAEFSTAYKDGTHRACQSMILPILSPDGKPLIFSLQHAFDLIRVGEEREKPCVGLDYSIGALLDIGFGLPDTGDGLFVAKKKAGNIP